MIIRVFPREWHAFQRQWARPKIIHAHRSSRTDPTLTGPPQIVVEREALIQIQSYATRGTI